MLFDGNNKHILSFELSWVEKNEIYQGKSVLPFI